MNCRGTKAVKYFGGHKNQTSKVSLRSVVKENKRKCRAKGL